MEIGCRHRVKAEKLVVMGKKKKTKVQDSGIITKNFKNRSE